MEIRAEYSKKETVSEVVTLELPVEDAVRLAAIIDFTNWDRLPDEYGRVAERVWVALTDELPDTLPDWPMSVHFEATGIERIEAVQ